MPRLLALLRSANGAGASAGTARNAGVSVDDVLAVAFRNSVHGALFNTSAASDAFVRNNICHNTAPPIFLS